MLIPKIRNLFCLSLCFMVLFFCGCPSQTCIKHQDAASVEIAASLRIDSVFIKANDSIAGCGLFDSPNYVRFGSKTHSIKFPINVSVQLFLQGDLWEELSIKMPKNAMLKIYGKSECLEENSPSRYAYRNRMEAAKKSKRFIDSEETDGYCWLLEKMNDSPEDDWRCTELSVDGKVDNVCIP